MLGPWLHVYPAAAITCADNITSDLSLPSHRARHVTTSHKVKVVLGFLNLDINTVMNTRCHTFSFSDITSAFSVIVLDT